MSEWLSGACLAALAFAARSIAGWSRRESAARDLGLAEKFGAVGDARSHGVAERLRERAVMKAEGALAGHSLAVRIFRRFPTTAVSVSFLAIATLAGVARGNEPTEWPMVAAAICVSVLCDGLERALGGASKQHAVGDRPANDERDGVDLIVDSGEDRDHPQEE